MVMNITLLVEHPSSRCGRSLAYLGSQSDPVTSARRPLRVDSALLCNVVN
jgi:hypothetical protein